MGVNKESIWIRFKQLLMRIISIVAILPAIWTMIFPQVVLANETINTNTNTEFQVNENIEISNGIAYAIILKNIPYNYDGYIPVKTPEEIKNEKILAKWSNRQESVNLPEGKFTINASAYTAAADECGKSDGITASGIRVKENRTLACPSQYSFGTKIKIEGYGTYTCEDRGGAIKGNHFDIYMKTKSQAFAFGRRNLTAEVVN